MTERETSPSDGAYDWRLTGSGGEAILGVTHRPSGDASGAPPVACVLLAHGFKGFCDYGFFPGLAGRLAAAGALVHRFNFSHSGMTRDVATFARPDLFERDTWNRQVEDLVAIEAAIDDGRLEGDGLPRIWFGHSRGGVTVLLAAGRGELHEVDGLITAAAPAEAVRLSEAERERLRTDGRLPSPSSRTGQDLHVGRAWLDEIESDAPGHDPLVMAGRIQAPWLVIHGEADATVPVADADRLVAAGKGTPRLVRVPGVNHVFLPDDEPAGPAGEPTARGLIDACTGFVIEVGGGGR